MDFFRASNGKKKIKESCAIATNVPEITRTNVDGKTANTVTSAASINELCATQTNENKSAVSYCKQNYDRCFAMPIYNNGKREIDIGQDFESKSYANNNSAESECINNNLNRCLELFTKSRIFFKIVHFNAQGLLEGSHFEHVCLYNKDLRADIIAISETWLKKSVVNSLVNIDNYKIFRSDRNFKQNYVKKGGGGVCAYIHESFKAKYLDKSNGARYLLIDFLMLEVQSPRMKFLLCILYRHGDCSEAETNEVFHRINELSLKYQHVIVCGDFNANTFDRNKFSKLNVLSDHMHLINDECPTYIAGNFNPSQLDLFFGKNKHDFKHFGHFPALGISNHQAIFAVINTFTTKKEIKTYKFRNLNNIEEEKVQNFAESIDWSVFSYETNLDAMIDSFYSIMNRFLDELCPYSVIKSKHEPVPWMNENISSLMSKRKKHYDWWKSNRKDQSSDLIYASFRKLDNEVKYAIRASKRECFIQNYNKADDLKDKWNLIHKFGVTRKSRKNNAHSTDISSEFTLDKLNEHFTKLKPLPFFDLNLSKVNSKFDFELISSEDVRKVFSKITSNATGPDGIPPKCFKLLREYIIEPISIIINTSFVSGYFPYKLKNISVTPILKIENPSSFSHFRPISNANYLLKVISSVSCMQLTNYLEINKLICEEQSGFRTKHSCTTAILKLTEDLHDSISRGKCIVLVLLDFTNAFGSVDHNRLIQVLKSVGVSNHALKWYRSFLKEWKQIVKHKDEMSNSQTITHGIIQGENNSQLLFSIFINNITKYINSCKTILFADDVQIYIDCDIDKINETIELVNNEIKNIEQFCRDYGISLNASKTKSIIISPKNCLHKLDYKKLPTIIVNNEIIEFVDNVRDLGYQLNRTLTNDDHVKIVQQKVMGALNTIYPLKSLLPPGIKLQLFKTLILPIIDYMDIIYHNYGIHGTSRNDDRLEKLQNICIRYILDVNRRDHITPHRDSLKLLKLFERRTLHVASILNKIITGEAPPYLNNLFTINTNNTRSSNKLIVRMPKNNFHKTSLFISGPLLWNQIPDEIRNTAENIDFVNYFNAHLRNTDS